MGHRLDNQRRITGRAVASAERHPLPTVALVAAVVRVAAASASFVGNRGSLIGDETQYVELARTVAGGRSAESWFPQFGQSLYQHTWTFTAPLRWLFEVLGPSRIVGQLYAAAGGVLVAVLTTVLAGQVVRRRWAVAAGLVVAVAPSQVLWSSVVLRESLVWAALACMAVGFAATFAGGRRAAFGGVLVVVGLLALGGLRQQAVLAAAWSLPVAAVVASGPRRRARVAGLGLVALLVPAVVGMGVGGRDLVVRAVPSLASTRVLLADQAASAYVPVVLTVAPTTTTTTTTSVAPVPRSRIRSAGGSTAPTTVPAPSPSPTTVPHPSLTVPASLTEVRSPSGAVYVVDESAGADVRAIPRGIVGLLLRPFPWEGGGLALRLAGIEAPLWYALYGLAAIGLLRASSRRRVLAFPVVVAGACLVTEALIQGNLGTAFRHRAELLWVLAVLAAVGAQSLVDGHRSPGQPGAVDIDLVAEEARLDLREVADLVSR